jgi:hypothetical protein
VVGQGEGHARCAGEEPGPVVAPAHAAELAGDGEREAGVERRPGHGLAPATGEGGSLALLSSTGDTFAYLTYRPAEGSGGDTTRELGIYAYGPHGDLLADRVTNRVRAWAAEQPNRTTSIEIYPLGARIPSPGEVLLTVAKEYIQVVARTAR